MLHHFEKYKNYQAPLRGTSYEGGYSFNKYDQSASKKSRLNRTVNESIPSHPIVDNLFFDEHPRRHKSHAEKVPTLKQTCVFQNETRKRVYSKLEKPINAIPGPGTYLHPDDSNNKRINSKAEKSAK